MSWQDRFADRLYAFADRLASVQAVAPGLDNDGLVRVQTTGTPYDRDFATLVENYEDALAAWRANTMAKRIVGLVTTYVVGDGIQLSSTNPKLDKFIQDWWGHEEVRMLQRQGEWCDELTRAGEIFPILFPDDSGLSWLRIKPAALIREVKYQDGDYERETSYIEVGNVAQLEGIRWESVYTANPDQAAMMHFAINRPVGCVRGEGDLVSLIKWLRRYDRWLEDRVRLNAGMRAFLWIVHSTKRNLPALQAKYSEAPAPGSVIFTDDKDEQWEAVAPNLHANDASNDGRALRWMIAAGAPGMSLVDFGEADDANLATANAMKELRRRFLRQRQITYATMLADITLAAYRRYRGEKRWRGKSDVSLADIVVDAPDISPEDNADLAQAAGSIVTALQGISTMVGDSKEMRESALRMFAKFAGEQFTDVEFQRIIEEGEKYLNEQRERERELADRQFEQGQQNQGGPAGAGGSGGGNGGQGGSGRNSTSRRVDGSGSGSGHRLTHVENGHVAGADEHRGPILRTSVRARAGRVQFRLTPGGIADLVRYDIDRDEQREEQREE